jgi:sugar/nucleoside kinase (ribokinase family)
MSQYDIYGMGNALVDMEIEVEDAFLEKMNIEKGLMTLVDEQRQTQLLEHLDGHQHKRACGGSAANTMIAAAQLGGKVFYSCKVASDETGDFYYNDLRAHRVDTNLSHERAEGVTGKCMVMITPDAQRTMNTYLGITETFSKTELNLEALKNSRRLYVEGYLVTSPTAREAVQEAMSFARENGIETVLTFSDPSMTKYFRDGLEEMIGPSPVDLLFCNSEEAMTFTQTTTLKDAFKALPRFAKSFAITRSEKGALLFDGQREIEVLTHQVEAIDTNGAGDLFAGSFLFALSKGHSFAEAGRLACAAASQLVTQFGPRLKDGQLPALYQRVFE